MLRQPQPHHLQQRYRAAVLRFTKKYGLALRPDAAAYLRDGLIPILDEFDDQAFAETLDSIADAFLQTLGSHGALLVERQALESVVATVIRKLPVTSALRGDDDVDYGDDEDARPDLGDDDGGRGEGDRMDDDNVDNNGVEDGEASLGEGRAARRPANLDDETHDHLRDYLHVLDAFRLPRWTYSPDYRTFIL
ncbi:hypothetical protein HK405_002650, partial [Cladochytrium tenue]